MPTPVWLMLKVLLWMMMLENIDVIGQRGAVVPPLVCLQSKAMLEERRLVNDLGAMVLPPELM